MDELGWLRAAEPEPMIEFLNERDASARKFRLFSCACARRVWRLMSDQGREGVEQAERFADGLLDEPGRQEADRRLRGRFPARMTPDQPVPLSYCADMVAFYTLWTNGVGPYRGVTLHLNKHGADSVTAWVRATLILEQTGDWEAIRTDAGHPAAPAEAVAQCRLARCVFGNPFRPVRFRRRWRTSTAVLLARQAYEGPDFSLLPILADALQDAGCDHPDVLDHCRHETAHARGCWVVDEVLGKN